MFKVEPKEIIFFTKPYEALIEILQEDNFPVNNFNYYPYQGA